MHPTNSVSCVVGPQDYFVNNHLAVLPGAFIVDHMAAVYPLGTCTANVTATRVDGSAEPDTWLLSFSFNWAIIDRNSSDRCSVALVPSGEGGAAAAWQLSVYNEGPLADMDTSGCQAAALGGRALASRKDNSGRGREGGGGER